MESLTLIAGQMLLDDFKKPGLKIMKKTDDSPVTEVDLKVSDFFRDKLKPYGYPVVTEEAVPKELDADEYFLIDPLDGTYYFIEELDYFAVLVAFIKNKRPVRGVIHFPVLDITFTAEKGSGAYMNGELISNEQTRSELITYSSGFHKKPEAKPLLEALNVKEVKEQDSILKLGYLAKGDVDIYPRFGKTYEWDTAAGQILLEEAGCEMWDMRTLKPMEYGKTDFLNKGFVAFRQNLAPKVQQVFQDVQWPRKK